MSTTDETVQRAFDSLLLKARKDGARAPTVVSVAAHAGISRSSMYRFHADIVARIQASSDPQRAAQQNTLRAKVRLIAGQLRAERQLTKALARACAELAAEKMALAEQLEEERLRFTLRVKALEKKLGGAKPVRVLRPT